MSLVNVNHWDLTANTGQDFLSHLRNASRARAFCREVIMQLTTAGEAKSVLEVGVGGLNEIISLDPFFSTQPNVRYAGTDWTPKFVQEARERFPRYLWQQLDITQCQIHEHLMSDIVYSQHVLEHCGGLNPALSNMLQFADKMLLNIFFLPPVEYDEIVYQTYPYYENRYGQAHIHHICNYHGFDSRLVHFDNRGLEGSTHCSDEVVLCAVKRGSGIILQ